MPKLTFDEWLAGLSTTRDAAHAASLSEIKAVARRAGVLARKRASADTSSPVKGFYARLLAADYRRVLVREPQKRLLLARGFADDCVYICLSELCLCEANHSHSAC